MTSTAYINPTIIRLDDVRFSKMDVLPGSVFFKSASFAIYNAGTISNLNIGLVPGEASVFYKYAYGLGFSDDTTSIVTVFKEDVTTVEQASQYVGLQKGGLTEPKFDKHPNLSDTTTGTMKTLQGILFSMMVKKIFSTGSLDLSSIDFTIEENRTGGLFFKDDATANLELDVTEKTMQEFNFFTTDILKDGELKSEIEFWKSRFSEVDSSGSEYTVTGGLQDSNSVNFKVGDNLLVMYAIDLQFNSPSTSGFAIDNGLDALDTNDNGNQVDYDSTETSSVISSVQESSTTVNFILEYTYAIDSEGIVEPTYGCTLDVSKILTDSSGNEFPATNVGVYDFGIEALCVYPDIDEGYGHKKLDLYTWPVFEREDIIFKRSGLPRLEDDYLKNASGLRSGDGRWPLIASKSEMMAKWWEFGVGVEGASNLWTAGGFNAEDPLQVDIDSGNYTITSDGTFYGYGLYEENTKEDYLAVSEDGNTLIYNPNATTPVDGTEVIPTRLHDITGTDTAPSYVFWVGPTIHRYSRGFNATSWQSAGSMSQYSVSLSPYCDTYHDSLHSDDIAHIGPVGKYFEGSRAVASWDNTADNTIPYLRSFTYANNFFRSSLEGVGYNPDEYTMDNGELMPATGFSINMFPSKAGGICFTSNATNCDSWSRCAQGMSLNRSFKGLSGGKDKKIWLTVSGNNAYATSWEQLEVYVMKKNTDSEIPPYPYGIFASGSNSEWHIGTAAHTANNSTAAMRAELSYPVSWWPKDRIVDLFDAVNLDQHNYASPTRGTWNPDLNKWDLESTASSSISLSDESAHGGTNLSRDSSRGDVVMLGAFAIDSGGTTEPAAPYAYEEYNKNTSSYDEAVPGAPGSAAAVGESRNAFSTYHHTWDVSNILASNGYTDPESEWFVYVGYRNDYRYGYTVTGIEITEEGVRTDGSTTAQRTYEDLSSTKTYVFGDSRLESPGEFNWEGAPEMPYAFDTSISLPRKWAAYDGRTSSGVAGPDDLSQRIDESFSFWLIDASYSNNQFGGPSRNADSQAEELDDPEKETRKKHKESLKKKSS